MNVARYAKGVNVPLSGRGFLALWNGVDPAREAEYDLWHTREHVPERIGIPGMIAARRYVDGQGPMPQYFTLYELESSAVLNSPPYLRLLETPTAWSRSMRPSFRGFVRFGCIVEASLGGGIGGAAVAAPFVLNGERSADALHQLLALTAVTSAHLGVVDPAIPPVPFRIGGDAPAPSGNAVLVLESFDRVALNASLVEVNACLRSAGLISSDPPWTSYRLGYAVTRMDLPNVATLSQ